MVSRNAFHSLLLGLVLACLSCKEPPPRYKSHANDWVLTERIATGPGRIYVLSSRMRSTRGVAVIAGARYRTGGARLERIEEAQTDLSQWVEGPGESYFFIGGLNDKGPVITYYAETADGPLRRLGEGAPCEPSQNRCDYCRPSRRPFAAGFILLWQGWGHDEPTLVSFAEHHSTLPAGTPRSLQTHESGTAILVNKAGLWVLPDDAWKQIGKGNFGAPFTLPNGAMAVEGPKGLSIVIPGVPEQPRGHDREDPLPGVLTLVGPGPQEAEDVPLESVHPPLPLVRIHSTEDIHGDGGYVARLQPKALGEGYDASIEQHLWSRDAPESTHNGLLLQNQNCDGSFVPGGSCFRNDALALWKTIEPTEEAKALCAALDLGETNTPRILALGGEHTVIFGIASDGRSGISYGHGNLHIYPKEKLPFAKGRYESGTSARHLDLTLIRDNELRAFVNIREGEIDSTHMVTFHRDRDPDVFTRPGTIAMARSYGLWLGADWALYETLDAGTHWSHVPSFTREITKALLDDPRLRDRPVTCTVRGCIIGSLYRQGWGHGEATAAQQPFPTAVP